MKKRKSALLIMMIGLMTLSGCGGDSGGMSFVRTTPPSDDSATNEKQSYDEVASTDATGSKADSNNDDEKPNTQTDITPVTPIVTPTDTTPIATPVSNFNMTFVARKDIETIYVTLSNDPFASSYDFDYYTLDESGTKYNDYEKATYENKEVYALKVKEEESTTTYTIKFYNKKAIQYGKSDLIIQIKDKIVYTSFLARSFTLMQIRFINFGYTIANVFKEFGEWLSKTFHLGAYSRF